MPPNEDELCADCLKPMGEDGASCHCYCADCKEWFPDCSCDEDED